MSGHTGLKRSDVQQYECLGAIRGEYISIYLYIWDTEMGVNPLINTSIVAVGTDDVFFFKEKSEHI